MSEQGIPRVAVVGCGMWGKNLVRNFKKLNALAAVCDSNLSNARKVGEEFEVPFRTFDSLLSDCSIDALVIATPAELHATLASEGLAANKHVYVEKPLALRVEDAEKLCRKAEQSGRILMVGHLLQYHPAFQKLLSICAEGRLGRIDYVYSNRLNFGRFRTEENTLWSFAPHDISMILRLIGDEPESVTAVGQAYLHKEIADISTTHLKFRSGQAAHIFVSWLHPSKEQRLVVVGQKGMAIFDDMRDWPAKIELFAHAVEWRDGVPRPLSSKGELIPIEPDEPLKIECQHFLDCIINGEKPRTDGREGLSVLKLLDAAQRSIETGRPVLLAPTKSESISAMIHETAVVDQPSAIGEGTRIWHFSHVLANSRIGKNCNIGQNVVIGPGATIGDKCKIQNNVSVYTGVELEDGVFCGPSCVFTNVVNPRAEIERKNEYRGTLVKQGATIGANATIVCGVTIGRYAFVGAGAVVVRDIPDYGLVVGNPARQIGHMCRCGVRLPDGAWSEAKCAACGDEYRREGEKVVSLSVRTEP